MDLSTASCAEPLIFDFFSLRVRKVTICHTATEKDERVYFDFLYTNSTNCENLFSESNDTMFLLFIESNRTIFI